MYIYIYIYVYIYVYMYDKYLNLKSTDKSYRNIKSIISFEIIKK